MEEKKKFRFCLLIISLASIASTLLGGAQISPNQQALWDLAERPQSDLRVTQGYITTNLGIGDDGQNRQYVFKPRLIKGRIVIDLTAFRDVSTPERYMAFERDFPAIEDPLDKPWIVHQDIKFGGKNTCHHQTGVTLIHDFEEKTGLEIYEYFSKKGKKMWRRTGMQFAQLSPTGQLVSFKDINNREVKVIDSTGQSIPLPFTQVRPTCVKWKQILGKDVLTFTEEGLPPAPSKNMMIVFAKNQTGRWTLSQYGSIDQYLS